MSELYREKIESLQAEESRLLAQKAAAQSAAAETVRQAEKDGAALVSQAQEAARRAAAMARMDDAVDYLLEKVVKR